MVQVMPTCRLQVQECEVANCTRKLKMVHLFNECQEPQKLDTMVAVSRQDRVCKDYTSNPIPTSFFFPSAILSYHSLGIHSTIMEKKDVVMGLLV